MRNAPRVERKLDSKQASASWRTKNAYIRFISSFSSIKRKIHIFSISDRIILPRKNRIFWETIDQKNSINLRENNKENH